MTELLKGVCSCGWPAHGHKPAKVICPRCASPIHIGDVSLLPPPKEKPSNHWLPLHRYPIVNRDSWSEAIALEWFAGWLSDIPNYGCDCQGNFAAYLKENPPEFTTPEAFFDWTVAAHNFVSVNHAIPRKEPITLEEAWAQYSK